RLVRSAFVRALIPVETEPAQAFVDQLLVLGPVAFHIGVVDAEGEGAAALAREQHVIESGAGGAEMREPRRARRDPHSNRVGHRHILRTCPVPYCWYLSAVMRSRRVMVGRTGCLLMLRVLALDTVYQQEG